MLLVGVMCDTGRCHKCNNVPCFTTSGGRVDICTFFLLRKYKTILPGYVYTIILFQRCKSKS